MFVTFWRVGPWIMNGVCEGLNFSSCYLQYFSERYEKLDLCIDTNSHSHEPGSYVEDPMTCLHLTCVLLPGNVNTNSVSNQVGGKLQYTNIFKLTEII